MNNGAVLIVDDEINICINLSKFISKLGFLSIIASNVADAKQKLKENNIKIIISDIIKLLLLISISYFLFLTLFYCLLPVACIICQKICHVIKYHNINILAFINKNGVSNY